MHPLFYTLKVYNLQHILHTKNVYYFIKIDCDNIHCAVYLHFPPTAYRIASNSLISPVLQMLLLTSVPFKAGLNQVHTIICNSGAGVVVIWSILLHSPASCTCALQCFLNCECSLDEAEINILGMSEQCSQCTNLLIYSLPFLI